MARPSTVLAPQATEVPPALTGNDEALFPPAPASPGICRLCRLPIDPVHQLCVACSNQPNHLDAILSITYAPRGGPVYRALRDYKNARVLEQGTCASIWIAGILWRFLEEHQTCLAAAAGTEQFHFATTIPSGDPDRDARRANLRTIVSTSSPISDRYRILLRPTGHVTWGRAYDIDRYEAVEPRCIRSRNILLLDDLWVTGGHAQSAAHALRSAGASTIALLTVGRYLRPDWPAGPGSTCADRLAELNQSFDWSTCAAESAHSDAALSA